MKQPNESVRNLKLIDMTSVLPRLVTVLCLILCALCLGPLANAAGAKTTTITTFDAPGAGTQPGLGTFANGMNNAGEIVGFVKDANGARHAFLREQNGTITMFNDPSAGTCSASCGTIGNGQGTRAYAISPGGDIVGFYTNNSAQCHGFVRSKQGVFTQIDAPDAGTGPFPQGTFPSEFTPMGINGASQITGFYVDASGTQHGFVRDQQAKIIEFDPPGSILTNPNAIDGSGNITGFYFDANFVGHAFLRDQHGTFTTIDAPGADMTGDGNGTFGVGLTSDGYVEGVYVDVSGVLHGFLWSKKGSITTYDVPGAGSGPGQGTLPESNNNPGDIAGNYLDGNGVDHGFLRDHSHGAFSTFDVPGMGTGPGQGTIPLSNNDGNTMTGQAIDANNVTHGFVAEGL